MTDLVFADTETISLVLADDVIWEFAGIRVDEHGNETVANFQIETDLGKADPYSLKVGHYHERFGKRGYWDDLLVDEQPLNVFPKNGQLVYSPNAADLIERFTRDAVLVFSNPVFDVPRLELFLRANLKCPGWHYHPQDIQGMVASRLRNWEPPYGTAALSADLGVEPPSDDELHTALGDARWVQRLWNALLDN